LNEVSFSRDMISQLFWWARMFKHYRNIRGKSERKVIKNFIANQEKRK